MIQWPYCHGEMGLKRGRNMTERKLQKRLQEQFQKKILDNLQLSEENVLLLERGKRGALSIVFGRTGVILVLLLLQCAMMFSVYRWLEQYVSWFYIINKLT